VWPFQRKAEAPADSGSRPAPAPVIRRDWTGLAPIQRLIGQHPLTAPSDRFSDDLATHHDPSVSTQPMGHQVSAEAPAGIVLALARPSTRNDGPAMISRPRVQRRVQGAIAESGEWDGDEAASPATRPAPLPAVPPVSAARELPVVAHAPVAQRLTTLSPEVEPVPVESPSRRSRIEQPLDLSATNRADLSDAPLAAPPRLTLGQARRLGLGAPITRVTGRAVQRAITHASEMPLAPSSVPQPSIATEDAEPARRDRTAGSPEEATTTAPVDLPLAPRESARIPQPDATSLEAGELSADPPVQRAMDISAASSTERATEKFSDAATPGRTEIQLNPVSTLPLVQRSLIQRAPTLSSPASDHRETRASPADLGREPQSFPQIWRGELEAPPASLQGEVSAPTLPSPATGRGELHGELAPLVSARPLRPTTLQRSTESAAIKSYAAEPLADETSTDGDEIAVPSSRGASPSAPTRSLGLPELTAVAAQPRYGPIPQNHQAASRHVQLQAPSGRSFVRAAALPLAPVQRAAAAESPQQEPGAEWASDVVQREFFNSPSSGVSPLSSPRPSPADAASAASTVASANGSMFGGHKPVETDMDELAGKLYDRIRTRLKSELLVDRERAGLLTDLR
jgi:hypothetical protein